jgi:hypothetical protein
MQNSGLMIRFLSRLCKRFILIRDMTISYLGVLRGRAARVHTTFRARLIKELTNHCRNPQCTNQPAFQRSRFSPGRTAANRCNELIAEARTRISGSVNSSHEPLHAPLHAVSQGAAMSRKNCAEPVITLVKGLVAPGTFVKTPVTMEAA